MKKYGFDLDSKGWFGIREDNWINTNTALVIIDMQNYDTNRNWALIGTEGTGTSTGNQKYYYDQLDKIVIPNLVRILSYFRKKNLSIIHVRIASMYKNLDDMPNLWRLRMYQHQRDSGNSYNSYFKNNEMKIIDQLKPQKNEIEILKTTGNAFTSTNLDFILKNKGIKTIIVGGVWLNSCVEDTVRVGADLGYLITLLEDGVAAPDKKFHNSSIRVLGSMYCSIRKTGEVINLLKEQLKNNFVC